MKTLSFNAVEFAKAGEAFQWYDASGYGDKVVSLNGKYYLVERAEADKLDAAGVRFAYVYDYDMPDGERRFITVPVN